MCYRSAADTCSGVLVGFIQERFNKEVSLAGRGGPSTVLTTQEESWLEDELKWASARHVGVGRAQ